MDCIFKFVYLAELLRGPVVRFEFPKHKGDTFVNHKHIKHTLWTSVLQGFWFKCYKIKQTLKPATTGELKLVKGSR